MIMGFCLLYADHLHYPYFEELLHDKNGKIIKNTLKTAKTNSQTPKTYIGEITLTGVLERSDTFEYRNALMFYPDSYDTELYNIVLDDKHVKLPSPLDKAFFGVSAARAEVTIKNPYSDGEDVHGKLVGFKLLGDIQIQYSTRDQWIGDGYYQILAYNSKDDYINIRDKANGKIIGKILKNDIINGNGLLVLIDIAWDEKLIYHWETSRIEVYYLPPNAKDGKDAIHGFVHGSQVKFENGSY